MSGPPESPLQVPCPRPEFVQILDGKIMSEKKCLQIGTGCTCNSTDLKTGEIDVAPKRGG